VASVSAATAVALPVILATACWAFSMARAASAISSFSSFSAAPSVVDFAFIFMTPFAELSGTAWDAAFRGKVKSVLKTLAPALPQAAGRAAAKTNAEANAAKRKRPAGREPDGSFASPRSGPNCFH
jgi:hypothetical protein